MQIKNSKKAFPIDNRANIRCHLIISCSKNMPMWLYVFIHFETVLTPDVSPNNR